MQLNVPSMVCDGCVDIVTQAIKSLDENAQVEISLETKAVKIDTQASESAVKEAIAATGHTVT